MLNKQLLSSDIERRLKAISTSAPRDGSKSDLTADMAKAISEAVVDHITKYLEVIPVKTQVNVTGTGTLIPGTGIGAGGGPAPVVLTTAQSTVTGTGTVIIPPGGFR